MGVYEMKKDLLKVCLCLLVLTNSELLLAETITGIVKKLDPTSRQIVIGDTSYRLALSATISSANKAKSSIDLIQSKAIVQARLDDQSGDVVELTILETP